MATRKMTQSQLRALVREALVGEEDVPGGFDRVLNDAELVIAAATRLVRAAQQGDSETALRAAKQVAFYSDAVSRDVERVGA